jgi:hypothetical protein
VARLRTRYGSITLVLLERSLLDTSGFARRNAPTAVPPVGYLVRVTADTSFAAAWSLAMSSRAAKVGR